MIGFVETKAKLEKEVMLWLIVYLFNSLLMWLFNSLSMWLFNSLSMWLLICLFVNGKFIDYACMYVFNYLLIWLFIFLN